MIQGRRSLRLVHPEDGFALVVARGFDVRMAEDGSGVCLWE